MVQDLIMASTRTDKSAGLLCQPVMWSVILLDSYGRGEQVIGKLQRVPLRDVWKHEAADFTKWLQDNIDVLNELIDLDLTNPESEQSAGAFSVDLVAEDESGNPVIIENQLEKSNHDHLGKILTYLVAMAGETAIWIVADPRPENV